MSFIYLVGSSNRIAASTSTLSASSTASGYSADNFGNGKPGYPWIQSAAALDSTITVDLGSALANTFVSYHGHNLDSGVTSITLASDDNSGFTSATSRATPVKASPSFYATFASFSERYVRTTFNGTNGSAIWLGEWVLGTSSTLTNAQLAEWSIDYVMPQMRQTGELVPDVLATNLVDLHQRRLNLSFVAESFSERNEIDNLFINSGFGAEPFICVPDTDDVIVIHGRLPNQYTWERIPGPSGGYHRTSFAIDEDPFPIMLP